MIHRITGTHAFTSGFGAALWLDRTVDGGQSQRVNIEQKVQHALHRTSVGGEDVAVS